MLTASRTPLEELVADFLVSGQARRLSPKTVDMVYRTRLERDFMPWCREHGIERVDQINQRVLDRYAAMLNSKISSRTGKPLRAASVHSYMRTVNAFLSWCRKEGEQVTAKGSLPRLGQRAIDVLKPEQVNRMEAVATSRHERDGLIIRLLYETGIRVDALQPAS